MLTKNKPISSAFITKKSRPFALKTYFNKKTLISEGKKYITPPNTEFCNLKIQPMSHTQIILKENNKKGIINFFILKNPPENNPTESDHFHLNLHLLNLIQKKSKIIYNKNYYANSILLTMIPYP